MLRDSRFFRVAMFVFGLALAAPVAMTVFHDVASASGYMMASGINDEPICLPGGDADCSIV